MYACMLVVKSRTAYVYTHFCFLVIKRVRMYMSINFTIDYFVRDSPGFSSVHVLFIFYTRFYVILYLTSD